jgi:MFS family permease
VTRQLVAEWGNQVRTHLEVRMALTLEQASPMIQDFFREHGTSTVTVAAAGGFVGVLSLFNMAGRFGWSATPDVIGRKPIYMLYLGGGIILYLLLATVGDTSTALFVLLAALILRSTAAGARPSRHTSRTSPGCSRWARSTAGCSPLGLPPASPDR